jgi:azurin
MNFKLALLTASCALALAACGDRSADTAADAAAPAPTDATEPAPAPVEPAPAPDAAATTPPPAATPASGDKPAAVVADCATEIEGNDAMQYNVGSITVPASCTEFKITLKHTGQLAVEVMGHNVVISKEADVQGVAGDGVSAGVAGGYLKADDARVVAKTELIGGGKTTSVSFPVSKIKDGGPYTFFCSFPGHAALMRGTISVQ